ncbi:heterokaryon incompatibility protein-domain-containing protein [Chaetomium sp. MPI-CAGE-AT-0009]|nr:heterokaryon incompatibility protein-domain-containing protein [Chaetomium sp. MPI-CAGE-AT-0009]
MSSTAVGFAASTTDRDALYDSVPLEAPAKQIRLLKLLPGQEGTIIRGELFVASLESNPEFEALSYVWGSPGATRPISVNNHSLSISESLHAALQAIRRRFCASSPITVWIDAICINQRDDGEKNAQVPLMSEVYTNASRVIIWLGDADAFDGLAMGLIRDVARAGRCIRRETGGLEAVETDWLIQRLPPGSSLGELLKSLAALVLRPWFRRTWILQELSLPRTDPLVLCGDFGLGWESFCLGLEDLASFFNLHLLRTFQVQMLQVLPEHDPRVPRVEDHAQQYAAVMKFTDIRYIINLRRRVQAEQHQMDIPFETMLWESTRTMATNPRDKVYGLLALAPEAARKQIVVDYTSDLASVYTHAVRYTLSTSRFGILAFAGITNRTCDPSWPSWLPRFDRPLGDPSGPVNLTDYNFDRRSIYSASHHLPNFHLFLDKGRLVLYGLPVDRVSRIGAVSGKGPEWEWVGLPSCFSFFSDAAKRCRKCHRCQAAPAGAKWNGQDVEAGESKPYASSRCREPVYSPCIPSQLLTRARAAMEGYVHVYRQQDTTADVGSSSWIKEDSECSVTNPSEKASDHGRFPWGYTTGKPFKDVIWRVFVGDYLPEYGGDDTTNEIPAPPSAGGVVFELLWDKGSNVELLNTDSPWSLAKEAEPSGGDGGTDQIPERLRVSCSIARTCDGRRPFITTGGWIGFGPPGMEVGDVVVVFAGADVPFIIRPVGEGDEFVLVGEAYVHGLMFGELFEQCPAFNGEDAGYKIGLQRFCLR